MTAWWSLALLVVVVESTTTAAREVLQLERQLEHLRRDESVVLREMRQRLAAAAKTDDVSAAVAHDNVAASDRRGLPTPAQELLANWGLVRNRARRTPDKEKAVRLCGMRVVEMYRKICPSDCAASEKDGATEGLATKCCLVKCTMEEIKSRCPCS